jgi:Tfp pilus assembly protein FimV
MEKMNEMASENDQLRGISSAATEDTRKQSAQFKTLSDNYDKVKKNNTELNNRIRELETSVTDLKKELNVSKRQAKKADSDSNSRDIRLNRLIDEVEKYKA